MDGKERAILVVVPQVVSMEGTLVTMETVAMETHHGDDSEMVGVKLFLTVRLWTGTKARAVNLVQATLLES